MNPICFIQTPFKEKFGVPRQPMLVPEAWGQMEFEKNDFFGGMGRLRLGGGVRN